MLLHLLACSGSLSQTRTSPLTIAQAVFADGLSAYSISRAVWSDSDPSKMFWLLLTLVMSMPTRTLQQNCRPWGTYLQSIPVLPGSERGSRWCSPQRPGWQTAAASQAPSWQASCGPPSAGPAAAGPCSDPAAHPRDGTATARRSCPADSRSPLQYPSCRILTSNTSACSVAASQGHVYIERLMSIEMHSL